MAELRLFVYPIVTDNNFAPHIDPEGKYLTLATCKPKIRRNAGRGDWVMAVRSGKAVYVFKVTEEPKTYNEYWRDARFKGRNDNIYYLENGVRRRKKGVIAHLSKEDQKRDWSGEFVLISDHFCRFGKYGPSLLELGFEEFIPNYRNCRWNFDDPNRVADLIGYFESLRRGHKTGLFVTPIHSSRKACE